MRLAGFVARPSWRRCAREVHPYQVAAFGLGRRFLPTKTSGMEPTEKPIPQSLAERIAKLWESPTVSRVTKVADAYTAKSLAKLNKFLARLNAKN